MDGVLAKIIYSRWEESISQEAPSSQTWRSSVSLKRPTFVEAFLFTEEDLLLIIHSVLLW